MSEEDTATRHGPAGPDVPPPTIPDFELVRRLDRGAFGEVWLGRSRSGVYRAVKTVPKGTVTEIEFRGVRTYETHARRHPNLIDVRHVGETEEFFYYVMELADRYETAPTFSPADYAPRMLKSDLRRDGPLALDKSVAITRQILDGLAHLHRHELLHRDIKPGNIVFVDGVAKLADIGLVTQEKRRADGSHTPLYAPEGGVVDRGGDLYCLGRVLYETVSGIRPDRYPEFPPDVDASCREAIRRILPVVDRACAPSPEERFETVAQFARALDQVVGTAAEPGAQEAGPEPAAWRRRAVLYALAGVAVVGAGLIFGPWFNARGPRSGVLDLLYKEHQDAAVHQRVEAYNLPLRTGELIRVRATLDQPGYPVIAVISKADGVQIAYPLPDDLAGQAQVSELSVPAAGKWWPLSPPDGTLTFVMLAAERPIRDQEELEAVKTRLAALPGLPVVAPDTMIRLVDGKLVRTTGNPDRTRGIPDVMETVPSVDGMLAQLPAAFADSFSVITAVAVPQVTVSQEADRP